MADPNIDGDRWLQSYSGVLALNPDGNNVGIGTPTPQSTLHVHVPASSTPVSALTIDVQSYETPANAAASHSLQVTDVGAGATHFLIRGDGNIGIGTANPSAKLQVDGAINGQGLRVNLPAHINVILDRTDSKDHMTLTVGSSGTGIHFGDSNFFFISADPYENRESRDADHQVLTILNDGRTGIGESKPKQRLHVGGNAQVDGNLILHGVEVKVVTLILFRLISPVGGGDDRWFERAPNATWRPVGPTKRVLKVNNEYLG